MKQDLINYARILNEHDTKNLSQKLTKTVEEVGELARVILPFEDAAGTIHRFTARNQILEEVIDVILCAQSIAHELDFDDEEIEAMFKQKLEKWGSLQQGEEAIHGKPIPFEIHVTVSVPNGDHVSFFQDDCEDIGVKPIVLDLQVGSDTVQDVMTSSVHFGSNRTAYEELQRIVKELEGRDFEVVRQKIETVPWHPAAPVVDNNNMPKDCYFESHLAVAITCEEDRTMLEKVAQEYEAHLSRNRFKTNEDGSYILMVTYRSYTDSRNRFMDTLNKLKYALTNNFLEVDKEIVEFSIYDTKVNHDAAWIAA